MDTALESAQFAADEETDVYADEAEDAQIPVDYASDGAASSDDSLLFTE